MKPIDPNDRKIANIHDAPFTPFVYDDGLALGDPLPDVRLDVDGDTLTLGLPGRWLDGHPLTRSDLDTEREYLQDIGRTLRLKAG